MGFCFFVLAKPAGYSPGVGWKRRKHEAKFRWITSSFKCFRPWVGLKPPHWTLFIYFNSIVDTRCHLRPADKQLIKLLLVTLKVSVASCSSTKQTLYLHSGEPPIYSRIFPTYGVRRIKRQLAVACVNYNECVPASVFWCEMPAQLTRVVFSKGVRRGWATFGAHRAQSGFLIVGLFGNIRSMTPLLVVSACPTTRAENTAFSPDSRLLMCVETSIS